jgi:tetratricopeptide (TPR) repeat protein
VARPILLILAILLSDALAQAQEATSDEELARLAEEAFQQGCRLRGSADQARPHFQKAGQCLAALRDRGVNNPLLYHNLGNAYLLAGDLPRAILAYRQGLHLHPGDQELQAALEAAREQVGYTEGSTLGRPPPRTRPPFLPDLPTAWLFWTGILLYALAWLFLASWLIRKRWPGLLIGLALLLGALTLAILVVLRGSPEETLVVIAEDGVLLRRGDSLTFPPRYETPLNRGVEARLLFRHPGWLQIQLPSGEVGWIPAQYALEDDIHRRGRREGDSPQS